jgi:DNA-binding beta-propeller fold protein YncE
VNSLEDRLRDAYRGAAETVRPEQVPVPRWAREQSGRREPPVRQRAWRKLIPLAAAAAVIVVAVGAAVVLPRVLAGTRTTPVPTAPTGPPPTFMAIAIDEDGGAGPMQVQDAATGRVVATVLPPRVGTAWAAAAAVTGHTFILAAQPEDGPAPGACYTLLYKLTLTAAGAPASLTPLDVPRIPGYVPFDDFAASANGMVAYSSEPCLTTASSTTTIGVIDTATAQTKRWTIRTGWFVAGSLALSADGRVLALAVPGDSPIVDPTSPVPGVWVLPTDSAPGPIAQRGHQVVRLSRDAPPIGAAVISADGSTVYLVTEYLQTPRQLATTIAAYDVATGALLRIVRTGWHMLVQGMSADPDTDHAVVWNGSSTEPVEVDLATGQIRVPPASLPHGFSVTDVAW